MITISQIYARFGSEADRLYRQAMLVASRHRVVRCHHLLHAAHKLSDGSVAHHHPDAQDEACVVDNWGATIRPVLAERSYILDALVNQEPSGCIDSPMTNSPTMRRILQLGYDRAMPGTIAPAHLITMGLACWSEEAPPGPADEAFRRTVGRLMQSCEIKPPPFFQVDLKPVDEGRLVEISHPPTVAELNQLIGPAVTTDDLIDLYLAMQQASDPSEKARLAAKLAYLRERG